MRRTTLSTSRIPTAEELRLEQDAARADNWKRWGPYLSERQWSTVREDYSANGNAWDYFPHDHARSRAYRWGEDGILGITDRQCRLCFALTVWNGRDAILKERIFGLTGPEGNHGEDCKECFFYLDSTPTHSYMKGLYKYPQSPFPYRELVEENGRRGLNDREFELVDTGVFDENRYFDVMVEYAKQAPDDVLIRVTVSNRGPEVAPIFLLPTLWFRNTWSWGCAHDGCTLKPRIQYLQEDGLVETEHETLGKFYFAFDDPDFARPQLLFTDNHTNTERLWGEPGDTPYFKDGFHAYLIEGKQEAVNPRLIGTKFSPCYAFDLQPGEDLVLKFRLSSDRQMLTLREPDFSDVFAQRKKEADEFYGSIIPTNVSEQEKNVARQSYAGLLWSKQFYHYVVKDWLDGDSAAPKPPEERNSGRNRDWRHVFCRDVISMPDKWEYPWFAAWDLAFHMIPFARIDKTFAKQQLELFLREWYMHPNGQLPAYEFAFYDVNPPVHAWAVWRVYKLTGEVGHRDVAFLESAFHKLILNFTWWVNRKDIEGNNLFSGGFLGLDNIGVFDRSKPLPTGGFIQQADGTAWMTFFCLTMLSISLELAQHNPVYENMASKFFEHFVALADAMNSVSGTGLWDEEDGFYYDHLKVSNDEVPLKSRSLVGLLPLIAVEVFDDDKIKSLKGFTKRMNWFLKDRPDLASSVAYCEVGRSSRRLLALPSRVRLGKILRYMLDEEEFLSPYGIRSLSRIHADQPYSFYVDGDPHTLRYVSGESDSHLFGGNSNWRGPIWFPVNHLIVEALEKYHHFYGDDFKISFPTGSGNLMSLNEIADQLRRRLVSIFLPNTTEPAPFTGGDTRFLDDPHWRELVLFFEYFDGDTGRGLGASHQTGWTALVAKMIQKSASRASSS